MTEDDFNAIRKATLDIDEALPHDNSILKAWTDFNRTLKNEMAYVRAARLGRDFTKYIRGERAGDPSVTDKVMEAIKSENPLAVEKFLDRFRWAYLEQLTFGQYFNLEFLILFGLKLQILEYYQKLTTSPKAKETFEEYKNSSSQLTQQSLP